MAQNWMGNSQLLLLVLSSMVLLVYSQPPGGLNWAEWFNVQHVRFPKKNASNDNQYCSVEMNVINRHTGVCKRFNSFLHSPMDNIINVCSNPSMRCKNNMNNCHRSKFRSKITDCTLTRGKFPPCWYRGRTVRKYFVIACNRITQGGQLLPVHLDSTS